MNVKLIFSVMVFLFSAGTASASTLVVNQTSACTTGDLYFPNIQEAVNAANEGDVIIVCPGTYIENVDVNKFVEIRSYSQTNTIVKASNPSDHVFYVTVDNVKISGFTITGASKSSGIYLNNSNNCKIVNNKILNNKYGIYLKYSCNNDIKNNNISSNNDDGICLDCSSSNNIVSNTISNNDDGISLWNSSNNNIENNNISSNNDVGFYLLGSGNNNIESNNISNNEQESYLNIPATTA